MNDPAYALARQVDAARQLKETYATAFRDDPDALNDAIEGQTDLFPVMETVLDSIAEDNGMIDALKKREEKLRERRERFEKAIELKRAMLHSAMQTAEVKSKVFPAVTISRGKAPLSVRVAEEAEVPSRFFAPQPPALNKKLLNDEAKAREKALATANKIADKALRKAALAKVDEEHPPITGIVVTQGGENLTLRFA